jgi:tetratricopeptide (TPR) repeat protein
MPSFERAREIQQRLLALRPDGQTQLKALGDTVNAIGVVWVKKNEYDKARKDYAEALRIRAKLAAADLTNDEYQWAWASTSMNIGLAEYKAGRFAEARKHFEEAQRIRKAASERSPKHAKLRRDLAMGYYNLANLDIAEGSSVEGAGLAEEHLKSAISVLEKLTSSPERVLDNERLLAMCYRILGDSLSNERTKERRQYYQLALARLEPLARDNPNIVNYQMDWAGLLLNLYDLELSEGNSAAARDCIEQARDIFASLVKRFPDEGWCLRDLAVSLRELAKVQDAAGESESAGKNLAEAIRILEGLVSGNPQEAEYAKVLEDTKAVMLMTGPR